MTMDDLRDHNYSINAPEDSLNVYSCKKCWYKTKLLSSMKPHMLKHHSRELFDCARSSVEMYRCGVCDFETNLMVKSHRTCPVAEFSTDKNKSGSKFSPMLNSYKCEKCKFEANSQLVFIKHVFTKCAVECEVFECDESNSIITYTESLPSLPPTENGSHSEDRKNYCVENEIKIYKNDNTLYKTETIYMPDASQERNASYRCDVCTYYGMSLHDLEMHKLKQHKELKTEKWFKCSMCKYENKSKLQVEAHILNLHNISYENFYVSKQVKHDSWHCCAYCNFESKSEGAMKVHCIQEHMRIKNVDNSTEAENTNTDLPFNCKLCPYTTARISAFNRHQYLQHTYIKLKNDWFHCPFCTYRSLVTSQMLTHLQEKHTHANTPLDPSVPNDNEELVQEFVKFIPIPDFKKSYEKINTIPVKMDEAVVEGPPKKKILLLPPATSAKAPNKLTNKVNDKESLTSKKKVVAKTKDSTAKLQVPVAVPSAENTNISIKTEPNESVVANTTSNVETVTSKRKAYDSLLFICQGCYLKASTSQKLKSHFLDYFRRGKVVYDCNKCHYTTTAPHCFKDHVEQKHKLERFLKFECPYCPFITSVFIDFTTHLLSKLQKPSQLLHKCRKCKFQSADFRHYNCHVLTHHADFNPKEKIIKCEYCSSVCSSHQDLKKHVDECHSFKCSNCRFIATNKAALSTHIMNKHTEFCSYCPFTTLCDKKMKEHVLEAHSLKCTQCSHVAKTPASLSKHMAYHLIKCGYCVFATHKEEEMRVHQEKEHLKCPCCPLVFPTLRVMYHHIVVKHNPVIKMDYGNRRQDCVEADGFKCISCSYVSKTESELSKHIITKHKVIFHNKVVQKKQQQSEECNLNCTSCSYKTNSESALAQHVKDRHGATLFKCEGCPYMHTDRSNIEDHVMKVHTNAEEVNKQSTTSILEKYLLKNESEPESESSNSGKIGFTCV